MKRMMTMTLIISTIKTLVVNIKTEKKNQGENLLHKLRNRLNYVYCFVTANCPLMIPLGYL